MAQLFLTAASTIAAGASQAGIGQLVAQTAASTVANFAASYADRLIFGPQRRKVEGPRLENLTVQASTEGASVKRLYGRARVAGQVIWAADFKETTSETSEAQGGKGGRPAAVTTVTEYLYSVSIAVGLCEGVIDRVGRVWADGKPLDLSGLNVRVYHGDEAQLPDPAIAAIEGAAPAFRGLAYVVFEDLPLNEFGNRIPQLAFEVEKRLGQDDPKALENTMRAVTMIPATGEFAYGTTPVTREAGEGVTAPENVNNNSGEADFVASLDGMQAVLPNVGSVSLVVSWFGTDLRVGACEIRPGVDADIKLTSPYEWRAGGVGRGGAHQISTLDGARVYGGTPADRSVIEAIREMKDRGLKVMFHPFILMDVPPGNGLPDPYGGGEQAAFPWRGRITVGASDKTAAAGADIAAFFGAASPAHFTPGVDEIAYSGPAEWSFRRMILHYAHLCALAGGVDGFIIGSELRGVTRARSAAGVYPAVDQLRTLAAEVRAILGAGAQISYGADWSEYFGHQPADGSGDVYFHLDPFWADANVDFIGIDNYMPLADWREGFNHADAAAGFEGPYDLDYLKANVAGGEGYDWFYASQADRNAQQRTPISDGAYGEDWIYRYKDLLNWWSSPHHNRPGGVRASAPTAWTPQSKPFVFTETGCAAIDKGANQPNVFLDPKSAESFVPYFSTGARDDLAQRRVIEAVHDYWREAGNNPTSSVYGGPMVDADQFYVYAWDGRPFPFFPARRDVWGDGDNWQTGHWLNGRAGRAPLDLLIAQLAQTPNGPTIETTGLKGVVAGYVVDRPLSPREMIDPLAEVFQFDAVESAGLLRFQSRDAGPVLSLGPSDLVRADEDAPVLSTRLSQDSDAPRAFRLGFMDEGADYAAAVVEARDPAHGADGASAREAGAEIAAVLAPAEAEARARSILADGMVMRESAQFVLPPSRGAITPGDAVRMTHEDGRERDYRIVSMSDGPAREVEAVRVSASVYDAPATALAFKAPPVLPVYGPPVWELMDLPLFDENDDPSAPVFAAFAEPWPGAVALYRSSGASAPIRAGAAVAPARMGRLVGAAGPGFSGRWDARTIRVRLIAGALASRSADEVLGGANVLALEAASGAFEIIQFENAVLGEDGAYTLSGLLRGQAGTEAAAASGAADGARVVLLNGAETRPGFSADLRGNVFTWQAGPDGQLPESKNFVRRDLTLNARGLTPLSPVHLRARADGVGGYELGWIRRTRIGGDSWEGEAPLGEAFERYQVTVYDSAASTAARRVVETTAPAFGYTAAEVTADFGVDGPEGALSFGVRQWSDRVGWGDEGRV